MRKAILLAAVAAPLLYRHRRDAHRPRVEIHFDDGSAVTVDRGPDAVALLEIARRAL